MKVKIKAKVLTGNGTINGITFRNFQSNISRSDALSSFASGCKLFYLTDDRDFDKGTTRDLYGDYEWASDVVQMPNGRFTGGYNCGYVSGFYTDENSNFRAGEEPAIMLDGDKIAHVVLDFDAKQNHYANLVSINGNLVFNNYAGTSIFISMDVVNTLEIKFLSLNKPFQPLELTSLYTDIVKEYEEDQLVDYSFLTQRKDEKGVARYFVVSQSGHIKVVDDEQLYARLSGVGLLNDNIPAEVFLNDEKYGEYILSNCKEVKGRQQVTFDLIDKVLDWDKNIYRVNTYAFYNHQNGFFNPITLESALSMVLDDFLTEQIPNANIDAGHILSDNRKFLFYDQGTKDRFGRFRVNSVIDNAKTLKDVLNKICEVALSCIYLSPNGNVTVKFNEMQSGGIQNAILN